MKAFFLYQKYEEISRANKKNNLKCDGCEDSKNVSDLIYILLFIFSIYEKLLDEISLAFVSVKSNLLNLYFFTRDMINSIVKYLAKKSACDD